MLFLQIVLIGKAAGLVQGVVTMMGSTFLLWGFAQTLIIFAANQLGADSQPPPLEKWPFLQGYLGLWALSVLGTLVFICLEVVAVWLVMGVTIVAAMVS